MTDLWRQNDGAPARLPFRALDANGRSWTDLANSEEGREATGFALAPPRPDDTETQTVEWGAASEAWIMVDRPPAPPAPEPQPAVLGKGEFLDLVLSTGVTLADVKAATDDPAMTDFWFALNNFYSQIRRDHPSTRQGLGGMVALGHISQDQADQVFETWPVA